MRCRPRKETYKLRLDQRNRQGRLPRQTHYLTPPNQEAEACRLQKHQEATGFSINPVLQVWTTEVQDTPLPQYQSVLSLPQQLPHEERMPTPPPEPSRSQVEGTHEPMGESRNRMDEGEHFRAMVIKFHRNCERINREQIRRGRAFYEEWERNTRQRQRRSMPWLNQLLYLIIILVFQGSVLAFFLFLYLAGRH